MTNLCKKAEKAYENSGFSVTDHFVDTNKMIELGKGAQRHVDDIAFARWMPSFENK